MTSQRAGPRPEADGRLVDAVRAALAEAAEPARAAPMQAYMRSALPYRGVLTPERRRLVRLAVAAHPVPGRAAWEATVRELWDGASYREERYAATDLTGVPAARPWQDPGAVPLYEHLVVTGAWWDHVDEVAIHRLGPIRRAYPTPLNRLLRRWAVDADRWRRRSAVIAQVGSKAATDTELLTDVIDANLDDTDFFLRKGIGWALRDYARTDAAWVRRFVAARSDRMSSLSRREALKHAGA